MKKHVIAVFVLLIALMMALPAQATVEQPGVNSVGSEQEISKPKYVFMFIGDGMSHVQINAAQVLKGNKQQGDLSLGKLAFTQFPSVGLQTTYDATSFCPDSASTATSLSSGFKTHSGVIGLGIDKQQVGKTIAERLKQQKNWKIGIVSTVTLNHATPAAYYAHVPSRNNYYDIGLQMAESGFEYFAGGAISKAEDGGQKSLYAVLEEKGYLVTDSAESILSLTPAVGKVYAQSPRLQDSGSMPYAMDMRAGDLTLAQFVKKGIDVLDNERGFFMMVESGKIDWACHANDAAAEINDLLAFDEAVAVALSFAQAHPDETLIVVTGDHETGGMTIGYAGTGYNTAFDILENQKLSYIAFDEKFNTRLKADKSFTFSEALALVAEDFGLVAPGKLASNKALVLSELEYAKLENAFNQAMLPSSQRSNDEQAKLLYGGYNPFSITLTHILNNKAGIGWTSYSHTGTPVSVYAYGSGSSHFSGSYDNTEIYHKLASLVGVV